ncbi:glycosyltransferase family 4 protein [Thermodesulforhabdus norvegica]|uniref:Glycosyltransferase involved in cell wall bisynthesis n=1 Tax=Thermodesulforhabdus norvegica TaxID=39841 RepID=A0A1I4TVA7_9BACT|nr:glycosyltransferase family 4 protein [Thermodesulforhabdus norvegica]SFM80748.1 Glycosyltransferase involved in cell wall bisynthesis [Thermodesulforhabdus norvegica]
MGVRLMVLNQYYAPDLASTGQIAAELCEEMARNGFEILVVTAQPSYTSSSPQAPSFEFRNGVHIHRVPLLGPRGREKLHIRLSGYLQFLLKGFFLARRLADEMHPEYVVTFHNPPLVPVLGAYLARKQGCRFVYILYDIHPDILLATGWKLPRILVKLWEKQNQCIFGQADAIVVLGEGMKQTLLQKGVPSSKIKIIPLWGRPELSPVGADSLIRHELEIGDQELVLLYAGNMGVMHPLEPLINAAKLLRNLPVRFVFLGDGVKREQLRTRVRQENLHNVIFLPFQPENRFVRLVAMADACFVVLEPGLENLAFPSRTFTFLSAGKPIIAFMSPKAEVAKIVERDGCGWNVTNTEQLVDLVRRMFEDRNEIGVKSQKARRVYEERFSRSKIIGSYIELFS